MTVTFISNPCDEKSHLSNLLRPHPHRTRTCNASKWDLLIGMRVSTLHASNIKGFAFEFGRTRPVWIGPKTNSFL